MMPPIPAVVMLPTETAHGYWPATVVAAIPIGHGSMYAVTAIDPVSSPDAPVFFAAGAGRSIHGFWVAEGSFKAEPLAAALAHMIDLARLRPILRTKPAIREPVCTRTGEPGETCNCDAPSGDKPGDDCRNCGCPLTMAQWGYLPR